MHKVVPALYGVTLFALSMLIFMPRWHMAGGLV